MRVSVEIGDPAYIDSAYTKHLVIYFNGEKLDQCVTADEEKGYVRCIKTDSKGVVCTVGDELEYVDYFGTVRIENKNGRT